MSKAIGGYFEWELPSNRGEFYPGAYRFQSARAAFMALLSLRKPTRVWMPWYICDSMIEPVRMTGVALARYAVDATLDIRDRFTLHDDEWLLYVNYFGVCDANVDHVLDSFPRRQVVIDNSQAFFSQPGDCLATIYSPRKFFGVPDGGYLITDLPVPEPNSDDIGSVTRCAHLLKRLAGEPEAGYQDYHLAEESLLGQTPRRMSQLTNRVLSTIDYTFVRSRRQDNFAVLHEELGRANQFSLELKNGTTPLCYPFLGAPKGSRERLIAQRIFVPTYWPDVIINDDAPAFERSFANSCLHLPCDQRNDHADVDNVLATLTAITGGSDEHLSSRN
jgi:hypothetical protein